METGLKHIENAFKLKAIHNCNIYVKQNENKFNIKATLP